MSNYNYDSYCGLYCGACDVLMAYKHGYEDKIAPNINLEPSQIKCHGCKTDTIFVNCRKCTIRSCAIKKKVDHCINCIDYPCNMQNELLQDFSTKHNLPHLQIIPKNLMTIKNIGIEKWLKEQDQVWKCPECQTDFSWYTHKCIKCGKDLDKIKDYNNL
ncbi:DUF3795 domain-containing protein [Desulfosporosinus sp. FKB]|uniref:DUF3795 domain-containing protein n=1 Tax=Desulfosporosinus sp. FKB TaxID=1969835 RepID=UPI000B4A4400|nr:DUF3795 domain-containing protein [Desulfosporosinus sp. FKB]